MHATLHMQDQVPPLVSLSKQSPVTHWMWRGPHLTTQEVCPLLDTTSHTLTHEPVTCYMDTLVPQWNPFSSSNQALNTLWGWGPWMLLDRGTLHRREEGTQSKGVGTWYMQPFLLTIQINFHHFQFCHHSIPCAWLHTLPSIALTGTQNRHYKAF